MIKEKIKSFVADSWVPKACLSLARHSLFVLTYHRIRQNTGPNVLADSLFGPGRAMFEAEMRWLVENTTPVSEAEVLECFKTGRGFRKRSVLVTFDDAYRDNFDVAAPILKRFSVPAIFFIPTDSISLRKVGWWDEIAWSIKHAKREDITISGRNFSLAPDHLAQTVDTLTEHCKCMQNGGLAREFVCELQQLCEASPVPQEVADASLMTWEQIRKLADYGISVGGHTVSHSALVQLAENEQRKELVNSKLILEEKTGRSVFSVAYPYGETSHFGEVTKSIARGAGFQLGFSLVAGINRIGHTDAFGIHRLLAAPDPDSLRLRMALATIV